MQQTSLHEAARFGWVEVAKLLVTQWGADVNATLRLGGNTVLHAIVDPESSAAHRRFYRDSAPERSIALPLCDDHVAIVELLLQNHALPNQTRFSDGLTAQDLVSRQLGSGDQGMESQERTILGRILKLLRSPPPVEPGHQGRLIREAEPHRMHLDGEQMVLCDCFTARLQYHEPDSFMYREVGVGSRISHGHEALYFVCQLESWAKSRESETHTRKLEPWARPRERSWRWIHVPMNNKAWVKNIIRAMKIEHIWEEGDLKEAEDFIEESYDEIRGPEPYARFRRPHFSPRRERHPNCSSLVIPYFDTEALVEYLDRKEAPNEGFRLRRDLERAYSTASNLSDDVHFPCTLDQSYYLSLSDATSTERDKTQVAVKYAERLEEESSPRGRLHETDKTIITAFPDRCCKIPSPDLLKHICQSLETDPCETMESNIVRILRHTLGFLDAPTNAGLQHNLFDIFEQSISFRAYGETDCYNRFHQASEAQRARYTDAAEDTSRILNRRRRRDEEEMCDISREIEHLCEIKDIRDELKMIERVLDDQLMVLRQYGEGFDIESRVMNGVDALERLLRTKLSKLRRLNEDARTVEASSFLMAVPSRDFPRNEEGSDIAWTWQQVVAGTLVTEAITFLGIAAFWLAAPTRPNDSGDGASPSQRRFKQWWRNMWGSDDWRVVEEKDPGGRSKDEETAIVAHTSVEREAVDRKYGLLRVRR
ncbi:hypothetical protein QBC47DRAFT_434406 [Echria macrotheca]|uniref:Ankyrin repeat protein n=1 Tax=Echria macrotheca TaxID=438768 RepID=A0AAJ0B474_9PEZI|nr:hypothetical protein QBC47DRAFT_434406 [Echria macrotheca]